MWLREGNCPWDTLSMEIAVNSTNVRLVEYMVGEGCQTPKRFVTAPTKSVMMMLHRMGYKWDGCNCAANILRGEDLQAVQAERDRCVTTGQFPSTPPYDQIRTYVRYRQRRLAGLPTQTLTRHTLPTIGTPCVTTASGVRILPREEGTVPHAMTPAIRLLVERFRPQMQQLMGTLRVFDPYVFCRWTTWIHTQRTIRIDLGEIGCVDLYVSMPCACRGNFILPMFAHGKYVPVCDSTEPIRWRESGYALREIIPVNDIVQRTHLNQETEL